MPMSELLPGEVPEFRLVDQLAVNGRVYQPWQEAVEREVILPVYNVEALATGCARRFRFPAEKQFEYLRDTSGQIVGVHRAGTEAPSAAPSKSWARGCGRTV